MIGDQVAGCPFDQLADDIQQANHPVGSHFRVVGLTGLWDDDSFCNLPEFRMVAQSNASSDKLYNALLILFPEELEDSCRNPIVSRC
jgi:hypothetical protein